MEVQAYANSSTRLIKQTWGKEAKLLAPSSKLIQSLLGERPRGLWTKCFLRAYFFPCVRLGFSCAPLLPCTWEYCRFTPGVPLLAFCMLAWLSAGLMGFFALIVVKMISC